MHKRAPSHRRFALPYIHAQRVDAPPPPISKPKVLLGCHLGPLYLVLVLDPQPPPSALLLMKQWLRFD
eukprot:NODE_6774_length_344_cov_32.200000_g6047_i0.p1 GENE.NODE_6774_length_344_cov_32.200000_g6047_i0~~NODE_6774_length_344_cov_32.200000_g6047_i0.p1  ORF type:complete len:68 (+),score=7.05 NODE_6774_length_344_cov_32.200000_g6047_i0:82-285(+)